MDWLEEAKKAYNEIPWRERKKYNPDIKTLEDIPEDLSQIESIQFTGDIPANELLAVLPKILLTAPKLREIGIHHQSLIRWDDLADLPLDRIEELYFECSDTSSGKPLQAPKLKKLIVYNSSKQLLPLELLTAKPVHFNLSGCPLLETLNLRYFQLLDPMDFQALTCLKRLVIYDSCLDNLDWLKNAGYKLDTLSVGKGLSDCTGLVYQPQLKELDLICAIIKDTAPIEYLKELESLYLYNCDIADVSGILAMNVEHKSLTAEDRQRDSIKRNIRLLAQKAGMFIRGENEKAKKPEDIKPAYLKDIIIRRVKEPFENRAMQQIQWLYEREIQKMEEPDYSFWKPLSAEEQKAYYRQYAREYYPFLK